MQPRARLPHSLGSRKTWGHGGPGLRGPPSDRDTRTRARRSLPWTSGREAAVSTPAGSEPAGRERRVGSGAPSAGPAGSRAGRKPEAAPGPGQLGPGSRPLELGAERGAGKEGRHRERRPPAPAGKAARSRDKGRTCSRPCAPLSGAALPGAGSAETLLSARLPAAAAGLRMCGAEARLAGATPASPGAAGGALRGAGHLAAGAPGCSPCGGAAVTQAPGVSRPPGPSEEETGLSRRRRKDPQLRACGCLGPLPRGPHGEPLECAGGAGKGPRQGATGGGEHTGHSPPHCALRGCALRVG